MNNNKENKFYNREERIYFFYRYYLFKTSEVSSLVDLNDKFKGYNFSLIQKKFIENILKNFEKIEQKIKVNLPDNWKWERLNFLERAVIFNGASEILLGNKDIAPVIDESINYAKKYCNEKSYSLINGILDNLKNNLVL